jgi:hypothetical protein
LRQTTEPTGPIQISRPMMPVQAANHFWFYYFYVMFVKHEMMQKYSDSIK